MLSNNNITYWWKILHVKTDKDILINELEDNISVYREPRTNNISEEDYVAYTGNLKIDDKMFAWEYIPSQYVILLRRTAYINDRKSLHHKIRDKFISNFPIDIEIKRIVPNEVNMWDFISHITSDENNISIITPTGNILSMADYGLEFDYSSNYKYPIDYVHSNHTNKNKRIEYKPSSNSIKLPLYGKFKENYVQLFSDILLQNR